MNELTNQISNIIDGIVNNSSQINDISFNDLKDIMNSDDVKDKVKEIISSNNITDDDIKFIGIILKAANIIYSDSGEDTGLTDSEYDALVSLYENTTNKELPIGAPIISGEKAKARYLTLRGTLSKVYKLIDDDILLNNSQKDIYWWIDHIKSIYKENTGKNLNVNNLDILVVPKYDGVSVVCEYTKTGDLIRAITRGDTDENESKDVTDVVRYVANDGPFTNASSEYAVKCEAMILNKDLETINDILRQGKKPYQNTRAAAAGILNTQNIDPDVAKYLHLIQLRYSYLENGIESIQYMSSDMYNDYLSTTLSDNSLADIREWAMKHFNVNPGYRCDGAVICIMNEDVRKALGRTGDKQNYEVAYKFTSEYTVSEVKDIVFQVGNLGKITPVVEFKKVKMKGNDVKRAAISYQDFIKYRLAKGDEIKVIYDIIPYVTLDENLKRSGNKYIKAPTKCPECGSTLLISETGKRLYCDNSKCPCRIKGKILNYMIKVGIENISYETVADLYDEGYLKSIEDIYKLKKYKDKISKLPGYGDVSINKILSSIESNTNLIPSKFLGALGIDGISTKRFHDLMQSISYEELLDFGFNKETEALIGLPGIKDKLSYKIITGIYENRKLIENLEKYVTILNEPYDNDAFFKICFTKIRDENLEKFIIASGGTVDNSSVTRNTTALVVPKKGIKSSKVDKAIKLGIPIVEPDELYDFIRKGFI